MLLPFIVPSLIGPALRRDRFSWDGDHSALQSQWKLEKFRSQLCMGMNS
ncbi:hypothetical protein AGR1A_Lc80552 [Agrobacterium fabacearum CFBP 5771]|nr:hypothetical protein AGR1A_Lc80552 [Agrobacterium fabacearum CFBP 5771]